MTQDQVLLIVLVVLIVGNVLLIATIPFRMRRRRPSATVPDVQPGPPASEGTARPLASAGRRNTVPDDDERVIAAIEAFVTGDSEAIGRIRPLETSDAIARPRSTGSAMAPDRSDPPFRRSAAVPDPPPPSYASEWSLAELGDGAMWSRAIQDESARAARFGHPVTVVLAELPRLDGLADRFGPAVVERVVTEAAHTLVAESRAVDRIARLGDARFGVLLPETDEVAARVYVERVRAVADGWLESTGLSIRLSVGWASPAEGGSVAGAAITAEQRMHDAARGTRPTPTIVPPTAAGPGPVRSPRRSGG
jgi:diguanylate cyclase (GGDEF)-like protein